MEVKSLVSNLDVKLKVAILRKWQHKDLNTENELVEIAQLLLPFIKDKAFCSAFDYLHCKLEHRSHWQKIKKQEANDRSDNTFFSDLRREFREARGLILDYIRYGKRSSEVDELLTKFVLLDKLLVSSVPKINLDGEASSRCSHCNEDCLASYRVMLGIILPILNELGLESSNFK